MVWPITGAESYVGKMGESMKVGEMVVAQEDGWRKIAIALTMLGQNALSPGYRNHSDYSLVFPRGLLLDCP
jgi:hypothetical protein